MLNLPAPPYLAEYTEVLSRPRFGFDQRLVRALLQQVRAVSPAIASAPLAGPLPDPDDDAFLEVAISAKVDCLVTGNIRHFPPSSRQGVAVLTPRAFIETLRAAP